MFSKGVLNKYIDDSPRGVRVVVGKSAASRGAADVVLLYRFEEALEFDAAGWMAELAQGLGFDLANALAGNIVLFADFLEGAGKAVRETIAQFENFAFPFRQTGEHFTQFAFEQMKAG